MTNVYDNAGHLERLGALARENEDLKRRLAELEKQEPVNARLLGVAHQVVGLIENTSIQAGYCCCGDGMDGHASPMLCGHSATDQGAYLASLLYKEAQSAIASAEAQQALLRANGIVDGAEVVKVEPVPVEAIGRLLTEAMDKAVENGASSVSMPDDYVAVAAWLCRVEGADNG